MTNPAKATAAAQKKALPAQVDIYDFDKTLVPFDSGSLFIGYCALRYPWILVYLPIWILACLLFAVRILNLQKFKTLCFGFLPMVPVHRAAKGFWDRHIHQVYAWFCKERRPVVVISASPDFLLDEMRRRLGIDYLLCTRHNPKTGRILGANCRGEEKVRRFHQDFPGVQVIDVYSDSLGHDRPIFSLATGTCYHVTGHKPHGFNYAEQYVKKQKRTSKA